MLVTVLAVILAPTTRNPDLCSASDRCLDCVLSRMPATHFASLFRTTHSTSEQGLSKSEHTMTRHFIQTEHEPAGCFVSPSPQLGMCIRWLSGGLYLDIYDRYGVSRSALYTSCLLERQQRERFSRGFDITGEVPFLTGKRRHSLGHRSLNPIGNPKHYCSTLTGWVKKFVDTCHIQHTRTSFLYSSGCLALAFEFSVEKCVVDEQWQ